MNERRLHRLESQIQARIAEVLLRELADPKIGMVTISRVELDREFTVCKAYWSVLGDHHQRTASAKALQRARGFVQREVGSTLQTRTVPHLEFVFDESIAGAVQMQNRLSELRAEREQRTGPTNAAPPASEANPAANPPDDAPRSN